MMKFRRFMAAFLGDMAMVLFAVAALAASFAGEPAEAYYFPRLVALLLSVFCVVNMAADIRRRELSPPFGAALCRKLWPGVLIMAVYVGVSEMLGFYPASAVAYAALAYCYGRRRLWPLTLATALVLGGVYLLFGVLLQVQTPEAFWVE